MRKPDSRSGSSIHGSPSALFRYRTRGSSPSDSVAHRHTAWVLDEEDDPAVLERELFGPHALVLPEDLRVRGGDADHPPQEQMTRPTLRVGAASDGLPVPPLDERQEGRPPLRRTAGSCEGGDRCLGSRAGRRDSPGDELQPRFPRQRWSDGEPDVARRSVARGVADGVGLADEAHGPIAPLHEDEHLDASLHGPRRNLARPVQNGALREAGLIVRVARLGEEGEAVPPMGKGALHGGHADLAQHLLTIVRVPGNELRHRQGGLLARPS